MRKFLLLLPALLLAACSGGKSTATDGNAAAAAPVAAAKPPAGQQWTDVVSKTPEDGYILGNPNAPIKLVEYGSRTCPVCGNFARTGMDPLINNYVASGKVSYEFRDYFVHGAPDVAGALLNRCVPESAFFPVLEKIYKDQDQFEKALQNMSQADYAKIQSLPPGPGAEMLAEKMGYISFMQQNGLPEAKARACLNDQKMIQQLSDDMQKATDRNIPGTPTFFINGNMVENTVTWPQLETALKNAGA